MANDRSPVLLSHDRTYVESGVEHKIFAVAVIERRGEYTETIDIRDGVPHHVSTDEPVERVNDRNRRILKEIDRRGLRGRS